MIKKGEIHYLTYQISTNKQPIQNEPTSENGNPTQQNTTQQNNLKLTQEQKLIFKNLKRILNREKTTLPSLRNIEWRIVKEETNKVNQVLTYIPTNNITDLNELIYAGAKLVCENIEIPSKKHESKVKTRMGSSTRNSDRKPTKTTESGKTKEKR